MRSAVEDSLRRLGMNQEPDRALESLRALRYPALERFARLLAVAQDTNREVFLKTLEILRREVEGRLDLGRQARQSLTLVRGTTRLLQAVAVTAMAVASVLPNWRAYFMAGFQHWLLFAGMLTVTLLSSFYMEAELRQLEV